MAITALAGIRRTQQWRLLSSDRDAVMAFEARLAAYRSAVAATRTAAQAGVVASSILLGESLSGARWWVISIAGFGSVAAIVTFEAIFRTAAAKDIDNAFRSVAVPLALLYVVTKPVARLGPLSAEAALLWGRADRDSPGADAGLLEQVRRLQELTPPEGQTGIDPEQEQMIRRVVALKETTVKEIMVPKPEIVAIGTDATLTEVIDVFAKSGHSRLPLYEGTLDNVVGVIYAREVLRAAAMPAEKCDLRDFSRPAYFVPETKKAQDLLKEFMAKAVHFALVVDEYGGIEGVVSLQDLLGQIVGDIEQEFEPAETDMVRLSESEVVADGLVSLDDLNEKLGTQLKGDGFETVGGFALYHLGHIPKPGARFEASGVLVEVLATSGRRVTKLRVRRLAPEQAAPPG